MTSEPKKDVLRPTDAQAIRLARHLMRSARFGALAVLEPETGAPLASRVAVASDHDGAPLILVSTLAAHTGGLIADPRASLLLGEPGKGDSLAHARITIACLAERIGRDDSRQARISRRFLARNPKSRLYAGFGDFSFYRLAPQAASLNGGFGKAYALSAADLLAGGAAADEIAGAEESVLAHMNSDHADAIAEIARHHGRADARASWVMTGIDSDGIDLAAGDLVLRIFFDRPLSGAGEIRAQLVAMTAAARKAGEGAAV